MSKKINIQLTLLAVILLAVGCSKFDEINTNPDGITTATSQMLATKLILNITKDDIGINFWFMKNFMVDKYILWSDFSGGGEQYNDFGRTSFEAMTRLIDVKKMIVLTEGMEEAEKNSYLALGHFIRAYTFFNLSMKVGDIPYTQALKGKEGNIKPAYDTQKEVFIGVLNELDKANKLFAAGTRFDGDVIYDGDPLKWRKMVNSFALKVLINLYKKTEDTDLNVINRFKEIVNTYPIFESNADNFSLVFSDQESQKYPFYKEGNQSIIYPLVSDILIGKLKELEDRRLFYYTEPSPVKLENGLSETDYQAYVGVNPAIAYSDLSAISSSKDYSDINDRYKEIAAGEPIYLLSYAQVQFILAEASIRGWISGAADVYYKNGVKAAMDFVAGNTPSDFNHQMELSDAYIQDYLEKPEVQLVGAREEKLEQIITQKYLSLFLQAPLTAYFENRRTGFPEFPVNPATNQNIPSNKLPIRWMYPSDEVDYNKKNVEEALNRQYNGIDDTNGVMWILQ